jgi:hypothetical protein
VSTCCVYSSHGQSRGRFESCGRQPIMLKITAWLVSRRQLLRVFLPQHSLNWIAQISDAVTSYTVQQNKHTARTILRIWENIITSCHRSPARQILEPLSKQHHQFTEHTARYLAHTGHTITRFRESGSTGFWSCGGMEEATWTRENVVGKVFPCEDQGGRGITVTVASGVVIWLHCGRSPPGI